MIRTPDQRLRVFISSTLKELQHERDAAREAVSKLRLTPVLFELAARPYPPRTLYRSYLDQSHVFVGIYWQQYGQTVQGLEISGLEDEYRLAADKPRLIYIREPAPSRDPRLAQFLEQIKRDGGTSYKRFESASELEMLIGEDLALLLSERFENPPRPRIPSETSGPISPRLRVPVSRFIGRNQEVQSVFELLKGQDTRLVTLRGPGGIGKSRLALRIAQESQAAFADGVAFVSLDNVPTAAMVIPAIVQTLGLRNFPGQTSIDVLEEHLRAKELLLVLDNFEHVVWAAPMLAELLGRCGRLKLLATSREVLRVSGEHLFDVPPLTVPREAELSVTKIGESEAVRLFVDRAHAVNERFVFNAETAPVVAEIVRQLEGLPLAIELAAARVRLLPPLALLQRLESRLGLLTGGPRDLPERQQTLRNTIDWSHSLLTEKERALLARLGVFVGGWTLEAADATCGQEGEAGVVDLLSLLIDKSLVRPEGFAGNEPWFTMLDLVREYALERLAERGEVELRKGLHAQYFLALAERGIPEGSRVPHEQSFERFTSESGNIRAAVRWLLDSDPKRAARMGWALWNCWWLRSHLSEAASWMEEILAAGEKLPLKERAKAGYVLGVSAFGLGDNVRAILNLERAHSLFRELGDSGETATALSSLGAVLTQTGNPERGEDMLKQALATFRELEDPWAITQASFSLGHILAFNDRNSEAVPLLEESVRFARSSGEKLMLVLALANLGWALTGLGRHGHAKATLLEALSLAHVVGNIQMFALPLYAFAYLAVGMDDPKRGAVLFGAAESLQRSIEAETWSIELIKHDRTRKALHASLGDDEFSQRFAEGLGLSIQDALKLASDL